jgi:hypothetical protein
MEYTEYRQFDVVRLLHTKNIKYLSGPRGRATSPKGEWSIIGFIDREAILAKQNTIIRIPIPDIVRIAEYNKDALFDKLKQAGKPTISVIKAASQALGLSEAKILTLCQEHKIATIVDSKAYETKAIEKLRKVLGIIKEDNDV